ENERLRERTAKTCGPDARYAGVKFRGNKLLRNDGGKRASAHRGEHVISRKAIAQGMSDCLRCPVCSCALYLYYCTRDRGCSVHLAFPAPSDYIDVANITFKPRELCSIEN